MFLLQKVGSFVLTNSLHLPNFTGYSKGGPDGRMAGAIISHLGDIPLVFICLKVAYDLV